MSFAHGVRSEHRARLPALEHPDSTTRAQTLAAESDPVLANLLRAFGRLTGYPVLVNTSLNDRGAPIVERPSEALDFLLSHEAVDGLVLGPHFVRRQEPWTSSELEQWEVSLAPGSVVSVLHFGTRTRTVLSRGSFSCELRDDVRDALDLLRPSKRVGELRSFLRRQSGEEHARGMLQLYELLAQRVLVPGE